MKPSYLLTIVVFVLGCKTRMLSPVTSVPDLAMTVDLRRDDLLPPDDLAMQCPPPSATATQNVAVIVHNASTSDRFVVTQGMYCDPFGISGVAQRLGFQCICECPPPTIGAMSLHRLAPDGKYTLPFGWDARAMETCSVPVDCSMRGWPGGGVEPELFASYVLAPPGAYTITVGYETMVPANCGDNGGDDLFCNPLGGLGMFMGAPAIQDQCTSTATASASFELPASGNVVVSVELN